MLLVVVLGLVFLVGMLVGRWLDRRDRSRWPMPSVEVREIEGDPDDWFDRHIRVFSVRPAEHKR